MTKHNHHTHHSNTGAQGSASSHSTAASADSCIPVVLDGQVHNARMPCCVCRQRQDCVAGRSPCTAFMLSSYAFSPTDMFNRDKHARILHTRVYCRATMHSPQTLFVSALHRHFTTPTSPVKPACSQPQAAYVWLSSQTPHQASPQRNQQQSCLLFSNSCGCNESVAMQITPQVNHGSRQKQAHQQTCMSACARKASSKMHASMCTDPSQQLPLT